MNNFFLAVYMIRFKLLAIIGTCLGWVIFADLFSQFIGRVWLDLIVYGLVGWYWLGHHVIPWVERKLEELFG